MKVITSVHNEQIKSIAQLHTAKGRLKQQQFLAEGKRILEGFARAGWKPTMLFTTEIHIATAQALFDQEPVVVSEAVMKKISTATTPSGIVAVFSFPPKSTNLTSGIVLANITDPGNMGTLIRSTAAFGAQSIVVVEGCDPFCPKVIQASAGALAHVQILRWSWQELIKNKKDLKLCALIVKGGQKPETLAKQNLLLVVGNEAHGLSQDQIADCDLTITLPMADSTESLNAAIAGSLALYLLK